MHDGLLSSQAQTVALHSRKYPALASRGDFVSDKARWNRSYKYPGGPRCTNNIAILAGIFTQGERFHEFKKDNFYQIQWRPRPASLLTSAEKKKVVKNLRKVSCFVHFPACMNDPVVDCQLT